MGMKATPSPYMMKINPFDYKWKTPLSEPPLSHRFTASRSDRLGVTNREKSPLQTKNSETNLIYPSCPSGTTFEGIHLFIHAETPETERFSASTLCYVLRFFEIPRRGTFGKVTPSKGAPRSFRDSAKVEYFEGLEWPQTSVCGLFFMKEREDS